MMRDFDSRNRKPPCAGVKVTSDTNFRKVARKFVARVARERSRLAAIVGASAALAPGTREELHHLAHRLAGSSSTFGWNDLGNAARALDEIMQRPHIDDDLLRKTLVAVVDEMDAVCEREC